MKNLIFYFLTDGSTSNMGYWKEGLELYKQGVEPTVNLLKAAKGLRG